MSASSTSLLALHLTPQKNKKNTKPSPLPIYIQTSKPKSIPSGENRIDKSSTQEEKDGAILGRREAVGLGISCLSLINALFFSSEETAAAAASAAQLETSSPSQCSLTIAPSGLAFCDRIVGTGPEATRGQLIKAHYVGKLEDGKVFDSSYDRGKPLTFRVGVGEVIKGWDQGILGGDGIPPMLAGGKRTLKLPPDLGYGIRGAGCKGGSCIIPPDSTLLFDVEFIGKA